MSFKYKNLSKSVLCMIVPMLVACGGKSRDNAGSCAELDAAVAALDSIQATKEAYADVVDILWMDYFFSCKGSNRTKDRDIKEYQIAKTSQISDSVDVLDEKSKELQRKIDSLQKGNAATVSDSIDVRRRRAGATKMAYANARGIFATDYHSDESDSPVVSVYQWNKMNEMMDSLVRYYYIESELTKTK